MSENVPLQARKFTPHAPPMLLVDEIISTSDNEFQTRSRIRSDNLFFVPGRGLPSYVGFEIMAQTISAFDGYQLSQTGEAPKLGFLLGCRRYEVTKDWFSEGETVYTHASVLLHEGSMRAFQCRIDDENGAELATGSINVFRPDSIEAFLEQSAAT